MKFFTDYNSAKLFQNCENLLKNRLSIIQITMRHQKKNIYPSEEVMESIKLTVLPFQSPTFQPIIE